MYEKIKKWCTEHKSQFVYGTCFVLVFIMGYGAGIADKQLRPTKRSSQSNYTTKSTQKANEPAPPAAEAKAAEPKVEAATTAATPAAPTDCPIKGNISGKNKIYHLKGGAFYDRTKEEICFQTEPEAVSAGFKKSSR